MRRSRGHGVLVGLLALAAAASCGDRGTGDVRKAFEKGDYREVITLGRHAVKTGAAVPAVHLYYGLALVAVGRDHEGMPEVDAAVASDSNLVRTATSFLWGQAAGEGGDAARRWRKALELSPKLDAGVRAFAVAESYYDDRRYEEAVRWYEQATRAFPDTSACEVAYSRLAECYAELGNGDKSRQAMEILVKRYPKGGLARGVASKLDDIAFSDAREAFAAGDFDRTVELARGVVDRTPNRLLQQKARFLLGNAYEAKGDRAGAYAEYREIVRSDRGDTGRLVEQARSRMAALQEAGVK